MFNHDTRPEAGPAASEAQDTRSPATPENIGADTAKPTPSLDCRFAGFGFQNWEIKGDPPIMVNPHASLHSKLAWCWGEVHQIDDLASVLCTHESEALQQVGSLLYSRTISLIAMLDHLSETTRNEAGRV